MTDLPKTFDPAAIEARWYAHWEATGKFRPERPGAEPWTIVNPPPNVTGSLHIGHALDNTLQDILVRHARLQGKDARWVVGTDHAGIATQMVVERNLASQGIKRTDMTRDEFVANVWEWKAQSGGAITRQLRRLGCSMDWANERFTMDEGFSKAVLKVFVQLHREGLLYRDKRLVNWDPGLKTAISDLEVETREVHGQMWHFKYPLAGGETYLHVERDADGTVVIEEERDYIAIATTRPETMLGDGAVAVNPEDDRYRPIVGKLCEIPVGPKQHRRLIPIITDDYPDPAFGSGAVKITGAHDENDYQVALRNHIPMYRLMDELAAMRTDGAPYAETAERAKAVAGGATYTATEIDALNLVPDVYRGLDRYEARARVIADIDAEGLMLRVENKVIMQPFGDRSNVVIEPMLTDQWYVDAKTLAQPAIEAVRSGAIKIVPKLWEKTFFNWMENIQPWCVSRQLWWGHRIPAWYGLDFGKTDASGFADQGRPPRSFVAETEEGAAESARAYLRELGAGWEVEQVDDADTAIQRFTTTRDVYPIWRDSDVLDTWFSSALWPFATLGWPEEGGPPRDGEVAARSDDGGGSGSAHPASPPPPPPSAAVPLSVNGDELNPPTRLLHGRYPNDVLVSGTDILFFWDARMMMQGLHFTGEVPFRTLYLHGLVRAADGQKMSKSKGNTVDPLGLIDRYGADALRFFMAAMESQGRDIKMDERRVEGYRNFATKLWNAARFCQANGIGGAAFPEAPRATLAVNKWIIAETVRTVKAVDLALAELRFDAAANAVYHFVWNRFCDWYLELIKPILAPPRDGEGDHAKHGGGGSEGVHDTSPRPPPPSAAIPLPVNGEEQETRAVAGWVLDQILVLLHPFMPFITEELWHALAEREHDLIVARWPQPDARSLDPAAEAEVEWLIRLVSEVRAARTELNVPPGARLPMYARGAGAGTLARLERNAAALARLARVELTPGDVTGGAAQVVVDEATFVLSLEGIIDLAAERARLAKAIAAAEKERDALAARLGNASFVERAKPEAVDKARADHAEKAADADRLRAAVARLG